MTVPKCTDAEFVKAFTELGAVGTARKYKMSERNVFRRRTTIEGRIGHQLVPSKDGKADHRSNRVLPIHGHHPHRIDISVDDGVVVVAGDAHYWPGDPPLMHRALVKFIKELKPSAVIMNGDVTDFASISRWPVVNWEKQPTVQNEIEVCQDRLHEIALAAGKGARKIWPLGNHDARFSVYLAQNAPEFAKVHGMELKHHFPLWEPCWSACINNNVIVKHFWKQGIHATHNNAVNSGVSMVTNHLHSAKVTPYTDYTGTRYAVDTGCIADIHSPAFLYLQDNPRNWREAFAVLAFSKGELLMPELVSRWEKEDETVQWRGKIIKIG